MENIEYMALSYALVWILLVGYVGIQHQRVKRAISDLPGEESEE